MYKFVVFFIFILVIFLSNYQNNNIENFASQNNKTKNSFIDKIYKIKENYFLINKKCSQAINQKNKKYYNKFINAYSNFLRLEFKNKLGYVPEKSSENDLTLKELKLYYKILGNMPNCDNLIKDFYNDTCKKQKNDKKDNWEKGWKYLNFPINKESCAVKSKKINSNVKPLLDKGIPIGAMHISSINNDLSPKFNYDTVSK